MFKNASEESDFISIILSAHFIDHDIGYDSRIYKLVHIYLDGGYIFNVKKTNGNRFKIRFDCNNRTLISDKEFLIKEAGFIISHYVLRRINGGICWDCTNNLYGKFSAL